MNGPGKYGMMPGSFKDPVEVHGHEFKIRPVNIVMRFFIQPYSSDRYRCW